VPACLQATNDGETTEQCDEEQIHDEEQKDHVEQEEHSAADRVGRGHVDEVEVSHENTQ